MPSLTPIPQESAARYVPTAQAYDQWAAVYDSDDNFLQNLDTMEMKTLRPKMISLIHDPRPWRVVDLGCGTGRNTVGLIAERDIQIVGLELSTKMLELARQRLESESARLSTPFTARLQIFDILSAPSVPAIAQGADAILSTLVLEHVPLNAFFSTAAKMLNPGGILLVTNMHADMGSISQAGFVDPLTGEKVRPTSYAHTVHDTVDEAKRQGFEVEDGPHERAVDSDLAAKLGTRAGKWIGVTVWYGIIFRKAR